MYCKKCGTLNNDDNEFCGKCGTELKPEDETLKPQPDVINIQPEGQAQGSPAQLKKHNIIAICIAAVIIIIGVITAGVIWMNTGSRLANKQLSLGEKYLSELKYDEAAAVFNKAIKIEPKNVKAYIDLSEAYIGLKETDKAIETLEQGSKNTGDPLIKSKLEELKKSLSDISNVLTNFYIIDYAKAVWSLELEEGDTILPKIYLSDTDKDGFLDLLIPEFGYDVIRMSAKDSKVGIRFDAHGGAAGDVHLVYNKESDKFAISYEYGSTGNVENEIKPVSGLLWKKDSVRCNGHATAGSDGNFLVNKDGSILQWTYYLNDTKTTKDKYLQIAEKYKEVTNKNDNDKLLSHEVQCNKYQISSILDAYGKYAEKQDGFVGWKAYDFNEKDSVAAVYVFSGCCSSDFANAKAYLSDGKYYLPDDSISQNYFPSAYVNGLQARPIIVIAESNGNGIVFKTMGIGTQLDISSFEFKNNVLTLSKGNAKYSYNYSSEMNSLN